MARHRLPIGLQTFRKIRERNCYYVDKTAFALRLVEEGDCYFLSRPRRFGKSLFLDTLKELFSGSRELFEGLYAFDRWDWSVRRPVLRLDFADVRSSDLDVLGMDVRDQLGALERDASMERHAEGESGRLRDLIRGLHGRTGRRVALLLTSTISRSSTRSGDRRLPEQTAPTCAACTRLSSLATRTSVSASSLA